MTNLSDFLLSVSVYQILLLSESIPADKIQNILLRIHPFSFVYFLCVGISILKIDLSHVHKWVSSDVIL